VAEKSQDRAVVVLEHVARAYLRGAQEVLALSDVSFDVRAGEMVALVGPSGCGKSTCLNMISGVDRPDGGRVLVCGVELASASAAQLTRLRRRDIGIVFQAFHLVPHLTVAENVALPLALDGRRDRARVLEMIERVGLAHRSDHYPSELSGGEEQRTAVARALVHRPRVVLADEPTGNLDSRSGRAVLDLIAELMSAEGSALVLATHDREVAGRADRVIALADGRVVEHA
jgi:ABC-type lipoprotein export system ATPase subunit